MRRRAVLAAACCLLGAGCATGAAGRAGGPGAAAERTLTATTPYVEVTGTHDVSAVWPSASAWLVLHSSDGFRSVDNRTPVAVATDGGLVGDFTTGTSAVAVGTTELLLRSPLLTAHGSGRWAPSELPGGVVAVRGAVALRPDGTPSAVVSAAHGTVLLRTRTGWRPLSTGTRLSPSGGVQLQTVSWLSQTAAVVTGTSAAAAAPVAFRTADGGRSWHAVPGLPSGAITALAPCRSAGSELLPVITRTGAEVVLRSSDAGARWQAGQRFTAASGVPAFGCSAGAAWTAAEVPGGTVVLTSTDAGRSWTSAGTAPADLTSLAPVDSSSGYATSGGRTPRLYAVSDGARRFRPIRLPEWVTTIGQQTATH